jgi:hypothetical protein
VLLELGVQPVINLYLCGQLLSIPEDQPLQLVIRGAGRVA